MQRCWFVLLYYLSTDRGPACYLELNEIHMITFSQHSRGFTIYKMIIVGSVPASAAELSKAGETENRKVCRKFMAVF